MSGLLSENMKNHQLHFRWKFVSLIQDLPSTCLYRCEPRFK